MKKVLITGVTGLVGDGLARYFIERGYFVYGTSRKKRQPWSPFLQVVPLELHSTESIFSLKKIIEEVDLVISNAATIGNELETMEGIIRINGLAVYDFLKIMENFPKKKFIYISGARSLSVSKYKFEEDTGYSNRDNYTTSKIVGEIIWRQFFLNEKVNVAALRISAPYGYVLNDAVIPRFIRKVLAKEDITLWGSGQRKQIFTFVEDIGYACELVLRKDAKGVFNVTGGAAISMKELAEVILEVFPSMGCQIVYEKKKDPEEGKKVRYCLTKAKEILGYVPQYDIKKGLRKLAAFVGV